MKFLYYASNRFRELAMMVRIVVVVVVAAVALGAVASVILAGADDAGPPAATAPVDTRPEWVKDAADADPCEAAKKMVAGFVNTAEKPLTGQNRADLAAVRALISECDPGSRAALNKQLAPFGS